MRAFTHIHAEPQLDVRSFFRGALISVSRRMPGTVSACTGPGLRWLLARRGQKIDWLCSWRMPRMTRTLAIGRAVSKLPMLQHEHAFFGHVCNNEVARHLTLSQDVPKLFDLK